MYQEEPEEAMAGEGIDASPTGRRCLEPGGF